MEPEEKGEPEEAKVESDVDDDDAEIEDAPDAGEVVAKPKKKLGAAAASHGSGRPPRGTSAFVGQGSGAKQKAEAITFVQCFEGTAHNPGDAVPGAEDWLAEEVPEACLGYPDYKKKRGANMFIKGEQASPFYKENGYWKIKVYKAGGYGRGGQPVFKFFKEFKRA